MTPPKYSLIVPTYNRIEELMELLPSISELKENHLLELIIVDDGSTDNTESFVKSFSSEFNITYLKQQNQGPGAARNYGMDKALGTYFLFVDSDCILPEDYLLQIDDYLKKNDIDAFGGRDSFHPSFSPLLKAIDYSMTSFIGTGGSRGSKKSITKFYPRSFNMGFHRKVYEKIGGYNALRHGQDMDYSARIYQAGFKVGLIPDSVVYHKRRTSIKKFFKQIFNWGVARINLSSLHPGFLKPIHLAPAFIVLIIFVIVLGAMLDHISLDVIYAGLILTSIIGIFAFSQALFKYKSVKVAFLSILTLFTQVLAYGLGTLSGLYQRYLLNRKESKGFTKRYYQ